MRERRWRLIQQVQLGKSEEAAGLSCAQLLTSGSPNVTDPRINCHCQDASSLVQSLNAKPSQH